MSAARATLPPVWSGRWRMRIRCVANMARTWLYLHLRTPWVVARGFVRIPWSVRLWSPHKHIVMGDRVQFGARCTVQTDTDIGDGVLIAANVAFVNRDDHCFEEPGVALWDAPRGDKFRVVIESDVWIGHGAIVLSGVTVGRGAVVGAGSVVTKDVAPYAVVAGNPARVLRMRFSSEEQAMHERSLLRCSAPSSDNPP